MCNHAITAAVALCIVMLGPAAVEAAGDPDAARPVVAEHCTACHEVPGYASRYGRAAVNAPPFQSIADRQDVYTQARPEAFLRQPHFPMTRFILSRSDIDNIVAFIQGLRAR
jgi:mono/diheme cytochrome c family protein